LCGIARDIVAPEDDDYPPRPLRLMAFGLQGVRGGFAVILMDV
jgi:hypothetical protein